MLIMQTVQREAGKRNSEKVSIGVVRRFWARAGEAASGRVEGAHFFCQFEAMVNFLGSYFFILYDKT